MKVLILRNDAELAAAIAVDLIEKGFQVVCVETRVVAQALIHLDRIDLLIMDERVAGQLTHPLAISAERRNPFVNSIILTDRAGDDADVLYELLPSLYALLGEGAAPDLICRLTLSLVEHMSDPEARSSRNAIKNVDKECSRESLALNHDAKPDELAKLFNNTFPVPLPAAPEFVSTRPSL